MQDNVCALRLSFLSVHLLQYPVLCSQLCTSLCCQVFPFGHYWIFSLPLLPSHLHHAISTLQQQEENLCPSFLILLVPCWHTDSSLPRYMQAPMSPTPLPLNTPCFPLLAPCHFPGMHTAFPPQRQSESGPEVMDVFQNRLVSPGSFEV